MPNKVRSWFSANGRVRGSAKIQIATLILVGLFCAEPLCGQVVEGQAVRGATWGIARVSIPIGPIAALDPDPRVSVRETGGRIYYPAVRRLDADQRRTADQNVDDRRRIGGGRLLSRIGQLIRNANTPAEERQLIGYEMLFLFPASDMPLNLEVDSPSVARLKVVPVPATPIETRAMLERWWSAYRQQSQSRIDAGDYPPYVETYLTEMLGARLGLPTDQPPSEETNQKPNRLISTLELFTGAERLGIESLRRSAAGDWALAEKANLPLPEPPVWAPLPLQGPPSTAPIEPTAQHVPPECFYLRFGSYTNYQWFQDLSAENGGDIAQLISVRGIDRGANRLLQERLNLKSSELSRLFGPQVIDDMALIGHDLMLESGPAMGVLFKAKNAVLLRTSLQNDRIGILSENPQARQSTVKLLGRDVSLLDTPDHRLRSFWVDDGEYQLVTTSRYLAERFIAVSQGGPSLADSAGFRYARELLPLASDLTVFAYFSSDFFQHLVSPEYLIETQRRLRAEADLALVDLARLAAQGENQPARSVNELVAAGYLPAGFGSRPDDSGPIVLADDVLDSARGRRGAFIPVRDVVVQGITAEEAAEYRKLSEFYSQDWRQMDPLVAGIRRVIKPNGLETLEIRAEIAPLVPEKYGWFTKQLGPPTRTVIEFAPDDIIHMQGHVITDLFGGTIPPHHLFAAIKDTEPPPLESLNGVVKTYLTLRGIPGYLGAWPHPGVVDRLPLGLGVGQPVGPNTTRLIAGVYRWQSQGFSVLSFVPDVLAASVPYLKIKEADNAAQVRVKVGNLVGSKLEGWANTQLYDRALLASLAGSDFLQSLTDQLHIDPLTADKAAHRLLGGKIADPLEGEYQLVSDTPGLAPRWRSTVWPKEPRVTHPTPANYLAPPLRWFRGARAELTQYPDRMVLSAEVHMQRGDKRK